MESASGIVTAALVNTALRVFYLIDDEPATILELYDARYATHRMDSRKSVPSHLYIKHYYGQNMSSYIDKYSSLFSQLEFMGKYVTIPDSHKVQMLLASIDPDS